MTELSSGPVVKVKPQSNIYTLLLVVAIVCLAVTVGVVVNDLMSNYGLTFQELFTGQEIPPT
ncbi:hypothetical protein LCGC14_1872130 [marine sediment metagenome]|uniref:Uncharacterized protein n=1 Tax=marine sediment metagenome TaxID=412755 RepID=A0A0F9G4R9_9ZZZZ